MIRIIAGKHKGRFIPTVKNAKYKPSTGKFKEAVFSILSSGQFKDCLIGRRVLDLFAGSGNLAFEALSRGAGFATLVDINRDCLVTAERFANFIGEKNNTSFLHLSALSLPYAKASYEIVFIDPPYYSGLIDKAISSLIRGKWLQNDSILVLEMAIKDSWDIDKNLELLTEKIYGNTKLIIAKYSEQNKKTL